MLKRNYLARLKGLFFEQGISRRQSEHLIEELQDHLTLKAAEFQALGNNEADAERLAIESVGTPEVIAEKARTELRTNNRLLRWAWLPCGVGIFIASFLIMLAIMLWGYYFSGMYGYYNGGTSRVSFPMVQVEIFLFNWLPLLIGMGTLVLLIRFSLIGWESIFIIAIALGIAVSGVEGTLSISSVANTDKLCFFRIDSSEIFQRLFRLPGFSDPMPIMPAILKFFAPLGMCLFARYLEPRLAGKIST